MRRGTVEMTIVSTQGGRVLTVVAQHNRQTVAVKRRWSDSTLIDNRPNQPK
jgi:hypothetical protein